MAARGQQSQDSGLETTAVAVGGLVVVAIVLWIVLGPQIKYGLLQGAYYLLYPPRWFVDVLTQGYIHTYNAAVHFVVPFIKGGRPPAEMTLRQAARLYGFLAHTYYYAGIPLIGYWAWRLYRRPVALPYYGKLDIWDLAAKNVKFYPQIKPPFAYDLLNGDLDSGPFARPADYRDMAEQHGLLLDEDRQPTPWRAWHSLLDEPETWDSENTGNPNEPRIPVPYPAPYINERAMVALFSDQLGAPWTGWDDLPVIHQALFGIMAARIVRDKKGANHALFQMNRYWHDDTRGRYGTRCTRGLRLAARYHKHLWVRPLCQRHAFVTTVFTALLETAQARSGTFPTSDFLFLKVVDRPLFMALNQVGRRVAWPEAAGVRAHMLAEKESQKALPTPIVRPAVRAMAQHLANEGYVHRDYAIVEPAPPGVATGPSNE